MKYAVIEQTEGGENTLWHDLTKKQAVVKAKTLAKHTDGNIYVEWYRASDGQRGYLNPDGSHAITGEAY